MSKAERQSNIELLRIFAIIGVIILHYNNFDIGGGLKYVEQGSLNFYVLYFLESVFVCAVDMFMIISGYFMCEKKEVNIWRPIELIIQVILFNEMAYLCNSIVNKQKISIRHILGTLMPANYFVILYSTVYLLSPFINALIDKLSQKSFKECMMICFVLFSIYPTFVDVLGAIRGKELLGLSTIGAYGSQRGYSIVNFILMYMIGAYLRKGSSRITDCKNATIVLLLLCNIWLIAMWAIINEATALEYCNPLIIINAICFFTLFNRLDIGTNKTINSFSEGVFSVFLLHSYFIPSLYLKNAVASNTLFMLLYYFVSAIVIYLFCWCIYKIYYVLLNPLFRKCSDYFSAYIIAE